MLIDVDELHGLELGRNIVKNLHLAAKGTNIQSSACGYQEPLYDVEELRSIAPADLKQSFDIRSVIARIVDGSEFDEFKKLYGTVRILFWLNLAVICILHLMHCATQFVFL
jgi:3-methylcrotonyl-CoA carboxylase beta subunit